MTRESYFQYALRFNLLDKLRFYYTCFTTPLSTSNDYYDIKDNSYFVKLNNRIEKIDNVKTDEPLLAINLPITLFNADLANIEKSVETTVGRGILNYVLLVSNFNSKIPYINDKTTISKIESIVCEMLKNDTISVKEYVEFNESTSMLQSLSRLTTVAATPKTITPPTGIKEFKKKTMEEFDKKYGRNWERDPVRTIEFADTLKAFDKEYLKDDPTYGKATIKKIQDNTRAQMYLSMGVDASFGTGTNDNTLVFNSLLEGYPEDKKQLAAIYNASRAGSYSRGNETKDGGVAAKTLLRATSSIVVEPGDCGSTIGKLIKVTEDNAESLSGRYIIEGNKYSKITNPKSYIGKTIMIRSFMYCKNDPTSLCSVCSGEVLSQYRKGVSAVLTDISGTILILSLKKMHNAVKHLVHVEMEDLIC